MSTMLRDPQPTLDAGSNPPLPGEPHGEGLPRKFRPDIEGIRALAVLLVVFYHANLLGITGGYVGVDVFFVLSGFLITRQLVAGVDRRGFRELPSFYARRIKRLLPASTVVVVVTLIASYLWVPALQAKAVTMDALFTTIYGLNYRLAYNGTSYLHATDAISPLQHFWSLGVEEQFYVVWPLLIVLAMLLPLRVRYAAIVALLTVVLVVSFWYSATTTVQSPSWAYFSLHTRAWELAAGGLIALTSPFWTRLPRILSTLMAWGGIGAIVACAWMLDDSTVYPGTAAAIPVGATVAVLAAGCAPRHHSIERLLGEPVLQGIGKVSYSWYLWHWPMLVIFPFVAGSALGWPRRLEVVFLSLFFAILSYHVVENPVRHLRRLNFEWMRTAVALAAVVVAIAVIVSNVVVTTGRGIAAGAVTLDVAKPGVTKRMAKTLDDSLGIEKAPRNLTPTTDRAQFDISKSRDRLCLSSFTDPIRQGSCVFGDPQGKKTVVLFGDSHAEQYTPGLNIAAKKRHWKLIVWTRSACSVAKLTVYAEQLKRNYTECDQWRKQTVDKIRKLDPDLVIMSQSDDAPGWTIKDGVYADATATTVKELATRMPVTFLMDSPFPNNDIPGCVAENLETVSKCTFPMAKAYSFPSRREVASQAAGASGAKVVDPARWMCGTTRCPVIVGNMLVWRDTGHISATYAKWLAPVLGGLIPKATPKPTPSHT